MVYGGFSIQISSELLDLTKKSFKRTVKTKFQIVVFSQEILSSLEKVLNYSENYNDYQDNAIFGSLLCFTDMLYKGNRQDINEYGLKIRTNLREIIDKRDKLRSNFYKSIIFSEYLKTNQSLEDGILRIGQLSLSMETLSFKEYLSLVDKGVPGKDLSDKCISETMSSKSCVISSQCLQILINSVTSFGYHKTHQVLLALFFLRQNCTALIPFNLSVTTVLWRQCLQILIEALVLYTKANPAGVRDLFLEQMLFCGLSGFSEFLSELFVVKALSFQNPEGCFTLSAERNSECATHMSGLGLAFLCRLVKTVQQFDYNL